jgi:hypothetical protein
MKKLNYAEFEEHIQDQITRITLERGLGKLTEKQFAKECMDLAKWAADRMKQLPIEDQMKFTQSQAMEALSGKKKTAGQDS